MNVSSELSPGLVIAHRHVLRSGDVALSTPFYLPNGDGVVVFARRVGEQWSLTDGGNAVQHLRQRPMKVTTERREALRIIAIANEVDFESDEFRYNSCADELESGVVRVAQAQLQAALLPMFAQAHDNAAFAVSIGALMRDEVALRRRVMQRWHHPIVDDGELFPVDYHLDVPGSEGRNVFVVTSRARAEKVVNALLFLKSERIEAPSLILLDVAANVKGRPMRRLQIAATHVAVGEDRDAVREKVFAFAA